MIDVFKCQVIASEITHKVHFPESNIDAVVVSYKLPEDVFNSHNFQSGGRTTTVVCGKVVPGSCHHAWLVAFADIILFKSLSDTLSIPPGGYSNVRSSSPLPLYVDMYCTNCS